MQKKKGITSTQSCENTRQIQIEGFSAKLIKGIRVIKDETNKQTQTKELLQTAGGEGKTTMEYNVGSWNKKGH